MSRYGARQRAKWKRSGALATPPEVLPTNRARLFAVRGYAVRGEFVLTSTGELWMCRVPGCPGIWVRLEETPAPPAPDEPFRLEDVVGHRGGFFELPRSP